MAGGDFKNFTGFEQRRISRGEIEGVKYKRKRVVSGIGYSQLLLMHSIF